jgi:hypothetical protein
MLDPNHYSAGEQSGQSTKTIMNEPIPIMFEKNEYDFFGGARSIFYKPKSD